MVIVVFVLVIVVFLLISIYMITNSRVESPAGEPGFLVDDGDDYQSDLARDPDDP